VTGTLKALSQKCTMFLVCC